MPERDVNRRDISDAPMPRDFKGSPEDFSIIRALDSHNPSCERYGEEYTHSNPYFPSGREPDETTDPGIITLGSSGAGGP